jgi:hypothetical protein
LISFSTDPFHQLFIAFGVGVEHKGILLHGKGDADQRGALEPVADSAFVCRIEQVFVV